jgi:undecaprenyl diphosphate synthase
MLQRRIRMLPDYINSSGIRPGTQDVSTEQAAIGGKVETADEAVQLRLKERGQIPGHIAIIMDGNGRWAQSRGHDRVVGHYEGVESVRDIAEASAQIGVEYLTLYTFSTENWYRPAEEVQALMELLVHTIRKETDTLRRNRIRLNAIGNLDLLPPACRNELREAMEATRANHRMTLTLALSYSGRWEILEAARCLAAKAASGEIAPEDIDEDVFAGELTTVEMPDPDLLIRTGGEYRVSNFLLWQMAYSEMYITQEFWPAFRRARLYEAIENYQNRDRRFGRVHETDTNGAG